MISIFSSVPNIFSSDALYQLLRDFDVINEKNSLMLRLFPSKDILVELANRAGLPVLADNTFIEIEFVAAEPMVSFSNANIPAMPYTNFFTRKEWDAVTAQLQSIDPYVQTAYLALEQCRKQYNDVQHSSSFIQFYNSRREPAKAMSSYALPSIISAKETIREKTFKIDNFPQEVYGEILKQAGLTGNLDKLAKEAISKIVLDKSSNTFFVSSMFSLKDKQIYVEVKETDDDFLFDDKQLDYLQNNLRNFACVEYIAKSISKLLPDTGMNFPLTPNTYLNANVSKAASNKRYEYILELYQGYNSKLGFSTPIDILDIYKTEYKDGKNENVISVWVESMVNKALDFEEGRINSSLEKSNPDYNYEKEF